MNRYRLQLLSAIASRPQWTKVRLITTQNVVPDPMTGELMTPTPDIQPHLLQIDKTTNPKTPPPPQTLAFGRTFTDHMLTIPWNVVAGWGIPEIKPYGPIQLDPSATGLHYAQTAFEGMKAYRDEASKVSLFRPDMNMKRLNTSARRIALPTFNGDALIELIKQLVRVDKHWVPAEPSHSLYIRPNIIGTAKDLSVMPPTEKRFSMSFSARWARTTPLDSSQSRCTVQPSLSALLPEVHVVASAPSLLTIAAGTGAFKLGVNYGPGVMPQKTAAALGYTQNLWLHGPEHELTEVGTMNMFVVFRHRDTLELVTPPLDGMILPGVTRDSVLTLAKQHASANDPFTLPRFPSQLKLAVSERRVTMKEILAASKEARLVEMFGSGTAAVISPVDRIGYSGEDVLIPTEEDGMGPVSRAVWTELVGRQWGRIPSEWSVLVD
ncbi:Branched-chain-amino-acid aminotransferase [Mycena kentingensis (nom. inval.)]|nr:Branched-chain-amino-acid aminotransferase [Mycena kentingensis (nom. inval.)]